jgi:hypothetical protein
MDVCTSVVADPNKGSFTSGAAGFMASKEGREVAVVPEGDLPGPPECDGSHIPLSTRSISAESCPAMPSDALRHRRFFVDSEQMSTQHLPQAEAQVATPSIDNDAIPELEVERKPAESSRDKSICKLLSSKLCGGDAKPLPVPSLFTVRPPFPHCDIMPFGSRNPNS